MSKDWSKYEVIDKSPPRDWSKYEVKSQDDIDDAKTEGDSWQELLLKAFGTGVTNLADTHKTLEIPYNLMYGDKDNPSVKKAKATLQKLDPTTYKFDEESWLDKFRNSIKPKPTTSGQRIAANVADFAGSALVPFGNVNKAIPLGNKFIQGLNALKNPALGGAVGGVSGLLQENGQNPLVADLIASMTVPTSIRAPKALGRLGTKFIGLGPNSININTAKAASDLGIDLPASVLTNNKLTNMIEHAAEKNVVLNKLPEWRNKKVTHGVTNKIDDILERSGMLDTPDNRMLNNELYNEARNLIPKNAQIYPKSTLERGNKIMDIVSESLIPSENEKKVAETVAKINKQARLYGTKGVPVRSLVASKTSLNDTIDWLAPTNIKSLVKDIQHGIKEDLREYGIINPEWHNKLLMADEMYAGMQKRKELQGLIDTFTSPYKLSKGFNSPESNKFIKQRVKEQDKKTVDDLATISDALYKREQRNPNKSGTATTKQALGIFSEPVKYVVGTLPVGIMDMLINRPQYINRAVDRAINPQNHLLLPQISKDIFRQFPAVSKEKEGKKR